MNDSLIFGRDETQKVVSLEINETKAELFIQQDDGSIKSEFRENKYWILAHNQLNPKFKRLEGDLFYRYKISTSDRELFTNARREWKNQDIYSIYNEKESFMVANGVTYFKGLKHNEVSILSFDIETTGLFHNDEAQVLLISNTFRNAKGEIERRLFAYDEYESTGDMLKAWAKFVREKNPSILAGHNILIFDLPYLQYIAEREGVTLDLGRNGSAITFNRYSSNYRIDGTRDLEYKSAHVYGREIIDTLFLAYKYDVGRKYESYGLKSIIRQEKLETKDREYYDASQIRFKYLIPEEWVKIKLYCIHDSDEGLMLFDLMAPPFFYLNQSVPKSWQTVIESATGSQINSMMVRAYLQDNHSLPKASMAVDFEGAISIGNPGIYKNAVKVDVASLYPSIILQYEVCDVEKDPKKYFLQLVNRFTTERLKNKKLAKTDKYYDNLQAAQKIFINSAYGFLGSVGLLFNSPKKAEYVTAKGREILTTAIDWATKTHNFKLINADTDSITFNREDHGAFTNEENTELLKMLNELYPEKIRFEPDGEYSKVIVLRAKNYILLSQEGKLTIKGSALKASTKSPKMKQLINDVIDGMLNDKHNYINVYMDYVKEVKNIKEIKPWCVRKTITDKVLNGERKNETNVKDAIAGTEISEGDRCYMFYKDDGTLCLAEKFGGDYSKDRLYAQTFDTMQTFETVLDMDNIKNYKLKKMKKELELL